MVAIGGRTQTIGSRSTARKKDMRADAIDTFISMRCNFLLGTISNEWMSLVGTAPALANSIVCLKLVPMIEAALRRKHAILKSDFNKMRVFGELSSQGTSGWHPLEFLPGLVRRPLERNRMQFTCLVPVSQTPTSLRWTTTQTVRAHQSGEHIISNFPKRKTEELGAHEPTQRPRKDLYLRDFCVSFPNSDRSVIFRLSMRILWKGDSYNSSSSSRLAFEFLVHFLGASSEEEKELEAESRFSFI
ncbi:hypothetical protein B0H14DRAFT_2617204 [Mycena olivaceomarginata]|nr:hypothetical protein B0H14DRAFT_2617204 [Mycena olivaceomarginata]